MRLTSVSFALALASCTTTPEPTTPIGVGGPPQPPGATALPLIEASPTLDGPPVGANPGGSTLVVLFASWCDHCRDQFALIDQVRGAHPDLRVLGVNYRPHEEYDNLGDSARVRAYVEDHAPWLIVVPADERVYNALGRPPKVPTMFLYDPSGRLAWTYDRRLRAPPTLEELDDQLRQASGIRLQTSGP